MKGMVKTSSSTGKLSPVTSVTRKDVARNRESRGDPKFGTLVAKAAAKGKMGS